ncbi:MAG: hypothetical protein Q8P46_05015 [Hyphomicrobiales bacterium]|nr:hypothetical protein [Hyphomicrobiales bacterium]
MDTDMEMMEAAVESTAAMGPPTLEDAQQLAEENPVAIDDLSAVESTVQVVTPEVARHLRETAHFERQRKISEGNVKRLAAEMQVGRFIPGTQVYICVLPDGKELVINGNHTLEAVAACGIPQVLTVTRKQVADIDDAGRIYAVFDIHKARSWIDSLRATGQGEDVAMAPKVLSAIGVIRNRFEQIKGEAFVSRLDRLNSLKKYKEPAELLSAVLQGAPTETATYVKRAAIMAVALETFRYQASQAAEFWRRFAQDEGLVAGMPERAFLIWLRNNRNTSGASPRRVQARAAALAWNAAFRGDEIKMVKPNGMAAFYLLGTPWAKGLRASK